MKKRTLDRELLTVLLIISFFVLILLYLCYSATDIRSVIGEGAEGRYLWEDLFMLTSLGLMAAGMLTHRYLLSMIGAALAFLLEVSLSVPGGVFHYRLLLRGEAVYFGCLACAYLFRRQGALWGGLGVFLKLVFILYDEVSLHSAIRWDHLFTEVLGQAVYMILSLAVGFTLRDKERESDPDWEAAEEISTAARAYRRPYPRAQRETESVPADPGTEQEETSVRYGGDACENKKDQQ